MDIDYKLTSCSIAQGKNGAYLETRCISQESGDNGFKLNFFNPEYITAYQRLAAQGLTPAEIAETLTESLKKRGAHVEQRKVALKAKYIRCKRVMKKNADGRDYQDVLKDTAEEDAKPISTLEVHCIYSIPMEDAFYTSGDLKGTPIFVDKYVDGVKQTVPVKRAILDDVGQPVKKYWRAWAPEERAESTLEALYMLAPEQEQDVHEDAPAEQPKKVAEQPDDDPFAAATSGEQA